MIPLGSCTMKLNSAHQLEPLSWPQFANVHPFQPKAQVPHYHSFIAELKQMLATITKLDHVSFQPNSGAQGEFAGLLAIKRYHQARGDTNRNLCLVPLSAHGTNPASARMAGLTPLNVDLASGLVDMSHFKKLVEQHKDQISSFMITYPSTGGVFENTIREMIDLIHWAGGIVYMDGANMNAQLGYTSPGYLGADVCHLNLHKTFAIPHGGGGPGMGPICVNDKLKDYLPGHIYSSQIQGQVSSTEHSSASILLITYLYLK